MQWYVYILQLSNNNLYTGITNNVLKRLKTHRAGKGSKYVRSFLPCELVYLTEAEDHGAAIRLERSIKRLAKFEKFALCNNEGNLVFDKKWRYLGGMAVMT